MKKKSYFYIDDVVWLFRDLTREKPKSLFDNFFLKILKEAHEKYGLKVQLNLFYRTDFFYGNDEFTLAEMTDIYKTEWEQNADWIRFGFHAKQEFPDYPYINASYEDVKNNYEAVRNEVYRFATPANWGTTVNPHWRPMSKEGCKALVDCGVKFTCATTGEKKPYNGDPNSLPYGHAARLLQNKKPETATFIRKTKNLSILHSLCGYNHLTDEQLADSLHNLGYYIDNEIGINIKTFLVGPLIDQSKLADMRAEMEQYAQYEFVGWATHEQYFHKDYLAYQPDIAEKLFIACDVLQQNGFEYIFLEDILEG